MADMTSVLAIDFGNVHTRAVLIDLVEGHYRLVAQARVRTTSGAPIADIGVGLEHALQKLSESTGRRLVNQEGIITPEQNDRSGVDAVIITASLGRPMRAVLVGLVPDVSIASGLRAAAGTYVQVVETVSLEDDRDEEDLLNAMLISRPDLIYITGGTEDGAQMPVLRLAQVARLAVSIQDAAQRPAVLFAGNSVLAPQIRALFEGQARLFIADNVRPSLEDEALESAQLQLARAFDAMRGKGDESFETLGSISATGVLPTSQTYSLIIDYLGRQTNGNLLAVDVGSAISLLSASVNNRASTTIRTDYGVGHSANNLLEALGVEAIQRWLPFPVSRAQLNNYTLNKGLRPGTVPGSLRDLYIEHALVRAILSALLEHARPQWTEAVDLLDETPLPLLERLIAAGAALTQTGSPGMSALLLLDALQPRGVTLLQSDPFGLIPALGSLAMVNPEAVVQMLDDRNLETLGTVISLDGVPRPGRPAMQVTIIAPSGLRSDHKLEGGGLWVYALGSGQKAEVEYKPLGGAAVGGSKRRERMLLEGGTAGLIFDLRGRPLPLPADDHRRAALMPLWLSQITGDAPMMIDERWLERQPEETPAETPAGEAAEAPVPQRGRRTRAGQRADAQPASASGRDKRGQRGKPAPTTSSAEDDLPDLDFPDEDDLQPQENTGDLRSGLR